MKIAVIGAGAIGSLVAGYLKLKGQDVCLTGHPDSVSAIKEKGLRIFGVRGDHHVAVDVSDRIRQNPDLAILATKTQDALQAVEENLGSLKGATVLTTQNGVQSESIVSRHIPEENIISSIVMFGATCLEPGKVVHNFEGDWITGRLFGGNDHRGFEVNALLNKIFPVVAAENIQGMKYLKIFINANNCLPAILGSSMQEAFSDAAISRISIGIWKEGLHVVSNSGIALASLPDFPLERLIKLTSMPAAEAAKILSGIMTGLSKEPVYGSILQSIKRDKASEIDYINGEFTRLAKMRNLASPLNKKLVEMVHAVERTKRFFVKEELLDYTEGLFN